MSNESWPEPSHGPPPDTSLCLGLVAAPGELPPLAHILRCAGHAVVVGATISEVCRHRQRLDAIVLSHATLPHGDADAMPADPDCIRCLVFVGEARAHGLAAVPGTYREFLSDETSEAEVEALLERLVWRRRMSGAFRGSLQHAQALQARLLALDEEFVVLSHRLSHELQARLKHISGFARKLQDSADSRLNETDTRRLDLIRSAALQGHAMTRDLVSLAHLRRMPADTSAVDLAGLVDECIRDQGPRSDDAEWKIGHLPTVAGDHALLRLALNHLLANALKFSRSRDRSCIEIISVADATGNTVQVLDNGVGFDESQADRLFLPFGRLHPARHFEGNGLGLAMVRTIAERHGGRVAARSRPGGGAAFSFWLPPATDNPAAREDAAPAGTKN